MCDLASQLKGIATQFSIRLALRSQPLLDKSRSVATTVNTVVHLSKADDESYRILVQGIDPERITGLLWVNEEFSELIHIEKKSLAEFKPEFLEFYRGIYRKSEGASKYIRSRLFLTARRAWLARNLKQIIFNQRHSFRIDRMELLRKIVDWQLSPAKQNSINSRNQERFSTTKVMEIMHSILIFEHPKFFSELNRLNYLLESLLESDDLGQDAGGFYLKARAIKTLAEFEQEEIRHRDLVRPSVWVAIFTGILAIQAIVDTYPHLKALLYHIIKI